MLQSVSVIVSGCTAAAAVESQHTWQCPPVMHDAIALVYPPLTPPLHAGKSTELLEGQRTDMYSSTKKRGSKISSDLFYILFKFGAQADA